MRHRANDARRRVRGRGWRSRFIPREAHAHASHTASLVSDLFDDWRPTDR